MAVRCDSSSILQFVRNGLNRATLLSQFTVSFVLNKSAFTRTVENLKTPRERSLQPNRCRRPLQLRNL